MVEVTLNVSQPQDLALLLQLAQRLGIPYTQKERKTRKKVQQEAKSDLAGPAQVFEEMERLRSKMQQLPPQTGVDIAQLKREMNDNLL